MGALGVVPCTEECALAYLCAEKKADPGVPNSFVHKDKVLAEMAAEKRAVSLTF